MASDQSKRYTKRESNAIYRSLPASKPASTTPPRSLDKAVDDIYLQAFHHRNRLVTFYIIYTVAFSLFVGMLVVFQAAVRTVPGNETLEIIPEWTLSLLVAGMFGQFISLLTIVTTKVWTFEPFLNHSLQKPSQSAQNKSTNQSDPQI